MTTNKRTFSDMTTHEDLKDELGRILNEVNFTGTAFCSQEYPIQALPNPVICIQDFGVIGSPITKRDAMALKKKFPPGNAGRCEVDAKLIRFLNPVWDSWVEGVAIEIENSLDVSVGPPGRQVVLEKMIIYPPKYKSPQQLHQNQSPATTYGQVEIILPTTDPAFEISLSYGEESQTYTPGPLVTLAVGSYACVTSTVKNASGFCASLSFSLISPPGPPLPSIPVYRRQSQDLRHAMSSLAHHLPAPTVVAVCLKENYSAVSNFGPEVLRKQDKLFYDLLALSACSSGFKVYFGITEYIESGDASLGKGSECNEFNCEDADPWACGRGCGSLHYDEYDSADLEIDETGSEFERKVSLIRLFDANGKEEDHNKFHLTYGDVVGDLKVEDLGREVDDDHLCEHEVDGNVTFPSDYPSIGVTDKWSCCAILLVRT